MQSNTSNGASVRSTFPRNPRRKALLVFFLILVGIITIASTVAVYADVTTDGYRHHAAQKSLSFS